MSYNHCDRKGLSCNFLANALSVSVAYEIMVCLLIKGETWPRVLVLLPGEAVMKSSAPALEHASELPGGLLTQIAGHHPRDF